MGIQNCGFSNLWVLKIYGYSNLWVLKICGHSNVTWILKICGYITRILWVLKFVGSKSGGIEICGHSIFLVINHEVK